MFTQKYRYEKTDQVKKTANCIIYFSLCCFLFLDKKSIFQIYFFTVSNTINSIRVRDFICSPKCPSLLTEISILTLPPIIFRSNKNNYFKKYIYK